jgi:hypothetical protein
MLPLYTTRIEDLGQGDFVKVDWPPAFNVALPTPEAPLRQRFSPAVKVLDLKDRLLCRGCGSKGRAVVAGAGRWRSERRLLRICGALHRSRPALRLPKPEVRKRVRLAKMSDQEKWLNEILDILRLPRDTAYRDYARELVEQGASLEQIYGTLQLQLNSNDRKGETHLFEMRSTPLRALNSEALARLPADPRSGVTVCLTGTHPPKPPARVSEGHARL